MTDAGWEHRRRGTSHHKFTKANERTIVVVEVKGKVENDAVRDIARAIEAAGE